MMFCFCFFTLALQPWEQREEAHDQGECRLKLKLNRPFFYFNCSNTGVNNNLASFFIAGQQPSFMPFAPLVLFPSSQDGNGAGDGNFKQPQQSINQK